TAISSSKYKFKYVNDFIKKIIDNDNNNYNYNNNKPNILDIGTMDCTYIEQLNTIGTAQGINIKSFDDYSYFSRTDCVTIYDGINIPANNNTYDIITMFMVLHHIPTTKNIIKLVISINKVLKINGYILIREHDIRSHLEALYVDWI